MNFLKLFLSHLKNVLSEKEFHTWIVPLKVLKRDNLFLIYAPSKNFLNFVKIKYHKNILNALEKSSKNSTFAVEFLIAPSDILNSTQPRNSNASRFSSSKIFSQRDLFPLNSEMIFTKNSRNPSLEKNQKPSSLYSEELYGFKEALNSPKKESRFDLGCSLNKNYRFDNFITGKTNEIAKVAFLEIAMDPGGKYNPLFSYSRSGFGKTHLMHAVGNYIRSHNQQKNVLYVTSERFVKDYVDAIRLKSVDQFQDFYRSIDVLLIDDIQFIAGKIGSQEEFFHTFNALLEKGSQIILTADKYPKEIPKLEDRLVSRFSHGLTVTMNIPDLETRSAILIDKSFQLGKPIGKEMSIFIAKQIKSNVREIEGLLKKIINYSFFKKETLDENLVINCLQNFRNHEKNICVDDIKKIVAKHFNLKVSDLVSRQKTRNISRPRQLAIALSKELTANSLSEIGRLFGDRDHSTIFHAISTIKKLISIESKIRTDYDALLKKLS